MREIKFEYLFLNIVNKEFVKKRFDIEELESFEMDVFMLENSSLKLISRRQFTGLYDKKGVEIYEGDILKYDDDRLVEVFWSESGTCFDSHAIVEKGIPRPLQDRQDIFSEIIRNIYENPELPEGE